MAASIISHVKKSRVSSVLNRDVKQFGKQHLFDGQEETCWNSDQGSPQFIQLEFDSLVQVKELCIQFQGGFVGKECWVEVRGEDTRDKDLTKIAIFYPEDINSEQIFPLESLPVTDNLKITFISCTDFFGRVTVYKLDVIGNVVK